MKITNQEVPRIIQLKKACPIAYIRNKEIGYFDHIIWHSTLQHTLLEGKYQQVQTKNYVDGEHNGVVRIGLDVEATRKVQDMNYWRQLIASDPAMDGE